MRHTATLLTGMLCLLATLPAETREPDPTRCTSKMERAAVRYAQQHYGANKPSLMSESTQSMRAYLLRGRGAEGDTAVWMVFVTDAGIAPGRYCRITAYPTSEHSAYFTTTVAESTVAALSEPAGRTALAVNDSLRVALERALHTYAPERPLYTLLAIEPARLCRFYFGYAPFDRRGCHPTACEVFVDDAGEVVRAAENAMLCAD